MGMMKSARDFYDQAAADPRGIGTQVAQAAFGHPFILLGASTFMAFLHFRRRNMLRVHNCSLNIIERHHHPSSSSSSCVSTLDDKNKKKNRFAYTLKFRTLFERPLNDVLGGNNFAVFLVTRAASKADRNHVPLWAPWRVLYPKKQFSRAAALPQAPAVSTAKVEGQEEKKAHTTTISSAAPPHNKHLSSSSGEDKSALLKLPKRDFHRAVLKSISNQISAKFCEGYMQEAVCGPDSVVKKRFVVALTCEDSSQTFFFKTRSMVTSEEILRQIARDPETFSNSSVQLENPAHRTRLNTVLELAKEYRVNPQYFDVIEVAIPRQGVSSSSKDDDLGL